MERVQQEAANALAAAGFEVALLTTPFVGQTGTLTPYVEVWTIRGARSAKYSLRWWIGTLRDGPWWTWGPDVVVGVGDGAAGVAYAPRRCCPLVVHAHGTLVGELTSSLRTHSTREALKVPIHLMRMPSRIAGIRRADGVWAVGRDVSRELSAWPYRLRADRVSEIPNGIEPDMFRFSAEKRMSIREALAVGPEVSLGLFAARLHRQKGADLAVEALAHLDADVYSLVIVGEGAEAERLVKRAKRFKVERRVLFAGQLDRAGVAAMMSAADVLLFPTRRTEGLPLAVLEGAASGLPIITTDHARVPAGL